MFTVQDLIGILKRLPKDYEVRIFRDKNRDKNDSREFVVQVTVDNDRKKIHITGDSRWVL